MAGVADEKGIPVHILDFEFSNHNGQRTSKIKFDSNKFEQILKKAGDRNVALISIVGPSRQGKSYLLGFLLRYLESLNTEETDWFGYEDPKQSLEGFKWRSGIKPETSGMWILSEPFNIKLADGKDCSVLLMDTQGIYDEYTSQREWSTIVGLSLLTSSCLIFNFFNNLQEDTLCSLGAFIEYGLMATGENINNSPFFQKLMFLIRDWNTPAEFAYGARGGMAFLKEKLEIKEEHGEEAKRIRNCIRNCFEELNCFLMPDPGEKMKSKEYDGSIQGLNPKFSKNLENFVTDLLSPDDLKAKLIGGNPIKASELQIFFEKYVEVLNSEKILRPQSLFEATNHIINLNIVSSAKETYRKGMQTALRRQAFLSEKEILNCHTRSERKAVLQFEGSKCLGSQSIISEHKEGLIDDLNKEFKEYKAQNSEKKKKIIQRANSDSIQKYINALTDELGDSLMDGNILKTYSEAFKTDSVASFSEECSPEDPEILKGCVSILEEQLTHEEQAIITLNANRILVAENANKDIVQRALETYFTKMQEETQGKLYLLTQDLEDLHISSSREALVFYESAEKYGDRNFVHKFDEELKMEMDSKYSTVINENKVKKAVLELKSRETVNTKVKRYEEQMSLIVENINSEEELQAKHEACENDICSSFVISDGLPEDIIQAQLPELKLLIANAFINFQHKFVQNSRNVEAECEKSNSDSLYWLNKEMSEYMSSKEVHRTEDFDNEFTRLRQDAIDRAFDSLQTIGISNDAVEIHLATLKSDLEIVFNKLREQNNLRSEHACSKAQNDVFYSLRNYQEEVKQEMEKCRTEVDLDALQAKTKDSVIHAFESKYSNSYSGFVSPYVLELESEIDKVSKNLKELFQLKKEESEAVTKSVLGDAQKFYKEEFEKHFKNQDYMSPNDLHDLHKSVTKIAVERCKNKVKLTQIQMEDLAYAMQKVYLKYNEQNHMNMPTNPAIGIDLGTTYCCVGVYHKGKVTIIDNFGKNTTPSYVSFNNTSSVVGEAAKNQAHENPENTIYDAKRILGRKFDDPKLQEDMKIWPFTVVEDPPHSGVPMLRVRGKKYHPEQISAKLLQEMKRAAEDHLGCKVKSAVITVPAYFSDGQRQATIDAGKLAGLKVLTILNEPVAAAIAYRLQHVDLESRNVLIFDLGGGTFDVAVLCINAGIIDVKAVEGDTHLGGEDFDNNVVNHCILEFQSQHGINLRNDKDSTVAQERQAVWRLLRRLKSQCEDRKVDLSSSKKVNIVVDAIKDGLDLNVTMTREKFEDLNAALFAKTIKIVERVLDFASINKTLINDIVLIGGSTRIPKVQQLLTDFFNGKALNKTINPDEAVAYGAAIQAAILNGEIAKGSIDFTKIQDVTPMSLGVEVYGGGFSVIINKNTKIPVKLRRNGYTTVENNQTSLLFSVYQGEDATAKKNSKLGEFCLNGVPRRLAGVEKIDVEMEINEQGVLHVAALCSSTGKTKDLAITEYKKRLSRSAIQKILNEGPSVA